MPSLKILLDDLRCSYFVFYDADFDLCIYHFN